jgi:hypothetical protein
MKTLNVFFLLLLTSFLIYSQQTNQISASVISSGGEKTASASYILSNSVGEAFIGKSVNTSNQHSLGFWYVYEQSTAITDVAKGDETIPTQFKLEQNYPNPFNPSMVIKFGLPERSIVILNVYDILGNEITTFVNLEKFVGSYELTWNATNLPSGVYFYRLQASSFVETKKMILKK